MTELTIPRNTTHEEAMKMIDSIQNLTLLNCNDAPLITSLPDMPNLKELYCYNTQITKLPYLPKLTILNCYNTQISSLPDLPKLSVLYCYNTQITKLPYLPNLLYLECNFMTTKQYELYLKKCKQLIILSSIQTLGLNSNLIGLKDVNPTGFDLARLVKEML